MSRLTVRVTRKWREADEVCGYELTSVDGASLPEFTAGSHIDVYIRGGLVRQYSLCNAPLECHRYVIGVLREPESRGGSVAMHEEINEGDVIEISEPRNHFPLVTTKRTLLLAGGIGITPLVCMAEQLSHIDADFELHYCTRSVARTAFRQRLLGSPYAHRVSFHHDDDGAEQLLQLSAVLGDCDDGVHLYVCGPAGFIDFVVKGAKELGWNESNIHREYFGAKPLERGSEAKFSVQIASSGRVFEIPPDRAVTAVLSEHGVEIPVSCEQGVCGTCLTRVLKGEPDHRDLYLTDLEKARNDQFTPCCSRAKSVLLVLDL